MLILLHCFFSDLFRIDIVSSPVRPAALRDEVRIQRLETRNDVCVCVCVLDGMRRMIRFTVFARDADRKSLKLGETVGRTLIND
jgi:hypothetical protein